MIVARLRGLITRRRAVTALLIGAAVAVTVAVRLWLQWTVPYRVAGWILAAYAAVLLLIVLGQDRNWRRQLDEVRDEADATGRRLDDLWVWATELADFLNDEAEEDDRPTGRQPRPWPSWGWTPGSPLAAT